jgi:hypothetical protein
MSDGVELLAFMPFKDLCSATIWMDVSGDQDEICGFAWG